MSWIQSPLSDCRGWRWDRKTCDSISYSYQKLHNHFITTALQKQSALTAEISKVRSHKDTLASVELHAKRHQNTRRKTKEELNMTAYWMRNSLQINTILLVSYFVFMRETRKELDFSWWELTGWGTFTRKKAESINSDGKAIYYVLIKDNDMY